MIIKVQSIEGLEFTNAELFAKKPVLCIGEDAYAVVPLKAYQGDIFRIENAEGRAIELRLIKIEPLPKPVERLP